MDLIDISLYASYLLVIVSVLGAILAPVFKAIDDPESIKKSVISFGIIIIIFLICFFLADPNAQGVTPLGSKIIGASITSMYIFGILAVIGIVYYEVSNALK